MGLYSGNARGIWLLDSNTITDVESLRGHIDFAVIYAGIGDKPSLKFAEHYEALKALDIPIIGYVEADAEIAVGWTLNPKVWPNESSDPTCQMCYRQTKYPNGVQRNISAWIVDGSKAYQSDKKFLGDNWIAEIFNYTIDRMFKRFRKPVYPLIKKTTVDLVPKDGALINYLSHWASISTYEPALKPLSTGWGSAYLPGDPDAIQQPYSPSWDFWWYGASAVPGVTGAACLFLFNGSKTRLYNDLAYKPSTLPASGGDNPPASGDATIPADLDGKIDALTLAVNALTQVITALTDLVKPFFSKFK